MIGPPTRSPVELLPLRAVGLRRSIASEFLVPTTFDGIPLPLTFLRIQSDPRLMQLSARVQAEVRQQLSASESKETTESEDDAAYRLKLESWADALEIMLEEVLNELDRIKPMRIPKTQEMV